MPVLKSLSFTALPKATNDPVQQRRVKFVAKLEEQKLRTVVSSNWRCMIIP
jgi:tRNA-binding EMAP/Myf-like protein